MKEFLIGVVFAWLMYGVYLYFPFWIQCIIGLGLSYAGYQTIKSKKASTFEDLFTPESLFPEDKNTTNEKDGSIQKIGVSSSLSKKNLENPVIQHFSSNRSLLQLNVERFKKNDSFAVRVYLLSVFLVDQCYDAVITPMLNSVSQGVNPDDLNFPIQQQRQHIKPLGKIEEIKEQ